VLLPIGQRRNAPLCTLLLGAALAGCASHGPYDSFFSYNVRSQELPITVSSVPVQVRPCPKGFRTVAPLILGDVVFVPVGAEFRAFRANPHTLPPRYFVDAVRLGEKSPYTPVTGTVVYAEGRYVLTLSGGRIEVPRAGRTKKRKEPASG
jgi:hypothetical protein